MNKSEVKTKEDLERYYKQSRKFKFKNAEDHSKYKDVESIFEDLVSKGNSTCYIRSKKTQCETGRSRSIDDLIRICKYYIPDITIKEILQKVEEWTTEGRIWGGTTKFLIGHCSNIRKHNFWRNHWSHNGKFNGLHDKRLGLDGFTECKLTWEDIIKD